MIFDVVAVGVPLLVYACVPKFLKAGREWRWLLFAACLIMFISWYIPSPKIDGQQTQFFTHFVGGGIFTGLLWLYVKLVKKWRAAWWLEAVSLFALVSTLGVTNELFEFVLFKLGQMPHGITDTSYDLVANTLGALAFFAAYSIFRGKIQYDDPRD
jgi:hypothetical protein